ncbi:MAG: DUF167 domain-containing protein [Candidatus Bathyarchaeota archaeon]|nr:DUF167 family protein [Candidatus Bathyarchaeum tardum]WGM89600.1 MAG: DUF167 family protein [Candidatus Bathyarchaeum tardum]WNZ30297.1 MAG: DUF167 domain-containing protein [Candidatus Bathyarchaeota archaeon]
MKLQEVPEGVVLDVFVKPNAERFQLKIEEDELVALSSEAPVKGKVNKELLKQLTKIFGHKVELVSGFTSRQKRFLVTGIDAKEVEQILESV